MNIRNLVAGVVTGAWMILAAGCGGSGGSDGKPAEPAANHTVGGSLVGLRGMLVLAINDGDALTLTASGKFTFSSPLQPGGAYSVTIRTQPASQTCAVVNGSGTIGDADVTNVTVNCATIPRTVGGTVYGLIPSETLVLQINGGDPLTLSADGAFTFSTPLLSGASYSVAVRNQPANQTCTVNHGNDVVGNVDVTSIVVNCSTIARIVGGNVSALASSETVVLRNNGGDDLRVTANGNFSFTIPVAQSGAYNVTVFSQPASQTCSVANGSGTAGAIDITDVQVTCSTNTHTVGGTVSGLSGTVELRNNGADNLPLSSNGSFTFSARVAEGATYNITVSTQPALQTCVVTNGSGTMGGANVTNASLNCTDNTTTLNASVTDLALSVAGLTEYGVSGTPSSGVARIVTITNTGSYTALNTAVTLPTWPAGTISSTTCGSVLAVGASCTVNVTPGSTASSDGTNPCSSGTAPIPGVIQVSADNASTVSVNAVVLNYGCIYQGGHLYAFDDTPPNSQSIAGKVASTTDQAAPLPNGIIWSSNGSGGTTSDVVFDNIYGISDTSTTSSPNPSLGSVLGQTACNGAIDGACNTNNIYAYYQTSAFNAPINTSFYAAGRCTQTISGHSDWSLPAICEMGYGSLCGTQNAPALQNMQSNLVDFNSLNLLAGDYWSSTSSSFSPQNFANAQNFDATSSNQLIAGKNIERGVRCSRALSP